MSDFISPGQIDEVIVLITQHGTGWILVFVFFSMFVENIFPPYPGDAVIFAAGFISGSGRLSVFPLIILSIIGSVASILVVYLIGRKYGRVIFEKRRLSFLNPGKLPHIENWFKKYGDMLLLASRFLAGTRSLIALTAGIGDVKILRMLTLSGVSVIIWNCLVILSAYYLRSNWERVYKIFTTYNQIILIVIVLVLAIFVLRKIMQRSKAR